MNREDLKRELAEARRGIKRLQEKVKVLSFELISGCKHEIFVICPLPTECGVVTLAGCLICSHKWVANLKLQPAETIFSGKEFEERMRQVERELGLR